MRKPYRAFGTGWRSSSGAGDGQHEKHWKICARNLEYQVEIGSSALREAEEAYLYTAQDSPDAAVE